MTARHLFARNFSIVSETAPQNAIWLALEGPVTTVMDSSGYSGISIHWSDTIVGIRDLVDKFTSPVPCHGITLSLQPVLAASQYRP
jgi:hypothetical protein